MRPEAGGGRTENESTGDGRNGARETSAKREALGVPFRGERPRIAIGAFGVTNALPLASCPAPATPTMEINTDDFNERGLYLLLPEGRRIALTQARVETFAHAFETNLDRIPPEIRSAVHFHFCPICPEKDRALFCHALPATLAFLAELKDFRSHDRVGAVYRGPVWSVRRRPRCRRHCNTW